MSKYGPLFKQKWKELNKDKKRKRETILAFRHTTPAAGRGKKRLKITEETATTDNYTGTEKRLRIIKYP